MKFLAKQLCKLILKQPVNCDVCDHPYTDKLLHILYDCKNNNCAEKMNEFMLTISITCTYSVESHLRNVDRHTLILYLLGGTDDAFYDIIDPEHYSDFLVSCALFLKSLFLTSTWSMYVSFHVTCMNISVNMCTTENN